MTVKRIRKIKRMGLGRCNEPVLLEIDQRKAVIVVENPP
jgi:hypothetical protein